MNEQGAPDAGEVLAGLVTLDQLAAALGCRPRTIYCRLAEGLPSIRLGNKRYFDIAAVRQWIMARQTDRQPRKPGRPRLVGR